MDDRVSSYRWLPRAIAGVLVVALVVLLVVAALTHTFKSPAMGASILIVAAAAVTTLRLSLRTWIVGRTHDE